MPPAGETNAGLRLVLIRLRRRRRKAAQKPEAAATRPVGKRAAIEAAARQGKLPDPPDFSAETHKRFRNKLQAVVDLAKAGDLKGLRTFEINPVSSSPKAIARYRDLCVLALEQALLGAIKSPASRGDENHCAASNAAH